MDQIKEKEKVTSHSSYICSVSAGDDRFELELPDTLEAYVTVEAENDTEDDRKADEGDQNKNNDEDDGVENEGGEIPEYQSENVITVETLENKMTTVKKNLLR